jgi:hypothetical protein
MGATISTSSTCPPSTAWGSRDPNSARHQLCFMGWYPGWRRSCSDRSTC